MAPPLGQDSTTRAQRQRALLSASTGSALLRAPARSRPPPAHASRRSNGWMPSTTVTSVWLSLRLARGADSHGHQPATWPRRLRSRSPRAESCGPHWAIRPPCGSHRPRSSYPQSASWPASNLRVSSLHASSLRVSKPGSPQIGELHRRIRRPKPPAARAWGPRASGSGRESAKPGEPRLPGLFRCRSQQPHQDNEPGRSGLALDRRPRDMRFAGILAQSSSRSRKKRAAYAVDRLWRITAARSVPKSPHR
jgi:hypothetical protein